MVTGNYITQKKALRSGSSCLSSSELLLTFGLGKARKADSIEIHWPSGTVTKMKNVKTGQTITVKEGAGIVDTSRYHKRA